MAKSIKSKDANQFAKDLLDRIIEKTESPSSVDNTTVGQDKNVVSDEIKAAAATLGRKGGLKGGKARAKALSPKRRSEIAKKAASIRWHKK